MCMWRRGISENVSLSFAPFVSLPVKVHRGLWEISSLTFPSTLGNLLGYTHTWDGSVQVGVAEQLEQRGKLGLTGTHAPNLAFKSSFWHNIWAKDILRGGTRVKRVDDRICGLAGLCPELRGMSRTARSTVPATAVWRSLWCILVWLKTRSIGTGSKGWKRV